MLNTYEKKLTNGGLSSKQTCDSQLKKMEI